MIAKLIKGKGFRGALEYDLKQGKGLLLETNTLPMNNGVRQRKGGSQGWASPIINMS